MQSEKSSLNGVRKAIKKLLKEGVTEGIFPGAAAGVHWGLGHDRRKAFEIYGNASLYPEKKILKRNTFFDLASLTKPLATTMALLCLKKENKINLDEPLPSLLARKITGEKKRITIRNLLSHSSGFPAHKEYFRILKDVPSTEKKEKLENLILQEELIYNPGRSSVYSDIGFMLLGLIVEKKSGYSLEAYVDKKVLTPLELGEKIFYNCLNSNNANLQVKEYAATEKCSWRGKVLYGEVHDDNCYALGGVAGHSGLFGNIESVTEYTGKILDIWQCCAKHPNINKEDLKIFFKRQTEIADSSWVLGFDTPALKNSSSGKYFSPPSIGHLGFTGTSFWLDPVKKVGIILLTNRVHPSRDNTKIKQFRPYFHDSIMEILLT